MRSSRDKLVDRAMTALMLGAIGIAYLRTLAPSVTWANDGADSGDLVTAAATLGVAHPTGYPTYLLLAHLFQLIPLGDPAFRANLLSAVAALGTVLVVFQIVRTLLPDERWRATIAATIAALALGLSPIFWSQAVIAEVYSLNALFVALIVLFTLQALQSADGGRGWHMAARGLVAGLALGNHITAALPALLWLGAVWWPAAPGVRMRWLALVLVGLGAGLLVYLYLPLRARAPADQLGRSAGLGRVLVGRLGRSLPRPGLQRADAIRGRAGRGLGRPADPAVRLAGAGAGVFRAGLWRAARPAVRLADGRAGRADLDLRGRLQHG